MTGVCARVFATTDPALSGSGQQPQRRAHPKQKSEQEACHSTTSVQECRMLKRHCQVNEQDPCHRRDTGGPVSSSSLRSASAEKRVAVPGSGTPSPLCARPRAVCSAAWGLHASRCAHMRITSVVRSPGPLAHSACSLRYIQDGYGVPQGDTTQGRFEDGGA